MGIDAKDIGILLWKVLRISTNTVYTYVRKYPIVSGVSTVIFLLYTFLPRLFYFLLCTSPLIACSAFYLRNHLNSKPLDINNVKTVNGLSSESEKESEGGTKKADLKHQRSVRRNARRKVEEVGKDWDSSQASEDERDKVILTTLYGEIPNTRTSPKLQKFKKDRGFLVSEDFSFEPSLEEETLSTVVDPSEGLTSGGGETEVECSSSSEGEEEEEEGETSREDNKIVTWTEDDQKNLMDLGNSEMERNKRLEHLITRRRTRRLFLLAAEKSLMDMEVPSICVGRNYFGLDRENYMVNGIEMPESAPSVLLPTKNPFDLPYDPQEEKPNLSGDSFQQEFSSANPNEVVFCHHESFCRRIFPSEIQLDSDMELWKKPIDGWPRPQQQGSNDRLVGEKPLLTEGEDVTRAEANDTESKNMTEIFVSDSNLLLSPGEKEMDSIVSNQEESAGTFVKRNSDHRVGNSLVGLVPRNTGSLSSSLAAERQIYMEHFGYSMIKGHKVTQSVESDLQVEVSEIGSPPITVDGNNSSDDDKSPIVCESDTVKETGFSGEENEVEQKSIVDETVESQMLPVEKLDQDFNNNETSSIISPETDAAKQLEGLPDSTDVNVRSEEEERSESRHFLQESSDRELLPVDKFDQDFNETSSIVSPETCAAKKFEGLSDRTDVYERTEEDERSKCRHSLQESSEKGLLISEEATVPHTDEVISQREEESKELLQNSVDEINISYDSYVPETSERRTDEKSGEPFDGGQSTQEMQELVEAEASDVNQDTSEESSPTSVLPDMSLPLDHTYTLTPENLELTSVSEPPPVISAPESSQNHQEGGDRNSRETEGQYEASEEAREEDSSSDAIVSLLNTQHQTEDF
ncbi:hypothetical protein AALP_AA1G073400 [Arabis alpina]|uniref:Uncharacterized protein n=1 Tax=Arabis alpina TaxID=50452 RepID=A0A087HLR0_ARAAL|nr:hypothetical protein AALP_AA1G073400 [Arabis alpina]